MSFFLNILKVLFHCFLISIALGNTSIYFHSLVDFLIAFKFLIFYSSIQLLVWAYYFGYMPYFMFFFNYGKFISNIYSNIASPSQCLVYLSETCQINLRVFQFVLHSQNCSSYLKKLIVSSILGDFFAPFPTLTNSLFNYI